MIVIVTLPYLTLHHLSSSSKLPNFPLDYFDDIDLYFWLLNELSKQLQQQSIVFTTWVYFMKSMKLFCELFIIFLK